MATNKNIKINLDYSEFSGGISECQRKMGLLTEEFKLQQSALGNNASEVDKLTITQENLSQKIGLQIQIVEQVAEKFRALSESEGATASQVDNAEKAYMKQITKLNELTNELEDVNSKLEQTSKAEEETSSSTENAGSSFQSLATSITTTTAVVSSLVSAAQQVAQAIMDVATESTQWADDLVTLSSQIGVSTTTLQEWGYASSFVDVSVETLQSSLSRLTQTMGNAQSGSTSAQQAFSDLGVSVTNADGSLRSSEQVFYEVIDSLGQIENATQRDAASMAIFGRSAQDLNSLIEAGSGALQSYGAEAEQLGIVMSESNVQALAEMQNSFDRLDAVMESSSRTVSAAFAPALSSVADAIATLDPNILAVVSGVGSLVGIFTTLTPMLQGLAALFQLLTMAKSATAMATVVETGAEVGLGAAAMATNAALLPQIAIGVALVAGIAAIVLALRDLIDAYEKLADATDKATNSTRNFADASSGANSSDNASTSTSGRKGYALGGRVSGNKVWVGEQGAELVELPSGSNVYNYQESKSMTTSTNIFNVKIDAKNVDEFNKVVKVFNGLSQSMNRGGKVNG